MLKFYLAIIAFLFAVHPKVFSQACAPASNDSCINAITLIVNGPLIAGTTCGSTLEAGELTDCADSGTNQSVWYSFTAIADTMDVTINATGVCYLSSAVWGPEVSCPVAVGCHPISCQSAQNGPGTTDHVLSNLKTGSVYYVQVLYKSDSLSCGNEGTFTIGVSTIINTTASNPPAFSTCQTPGGPLGVFNHNPDSAEVVKSCPGYNIPVSDAGTNNVVSACFSFVNQYSSSINFNLLIEHTVICLPSSTNVDWLDWTLYDNNCNTLDCGNYNNMQSSGLSCGNTYELCYAYEIPDCETDNEIYPYVVAIPATITVSAVPDSICKTDPATLIANASEYYSYQWSPSARLNTTTGDTVTATPFSTTTYSAIGTDIHGCIDTGSSIIRVTNCGPIASYEPGNDTICIGKCVAFSSTSTGATSWQWHFAGGNPAFYNGETPPTICYIDSGHYVIRLVVSNKYGTNTAVGPLIVKNCKYPVADYSFTDTLCQYDCYYYQNLSSENGAGWQWTFEGGKPASYSGQNPLPICYDSTGVFQTRLIASNAYGSDTMITYTVIINCNSFASFTLSDSTICTGDCITITNTSPPDDDTSWQWRFPGGNPDTYNGFTPPQVCYNNMGAFEIQLVAANKYDYALISQQVNVTSCVPIADFTANDSVICENDCTGFNNLCSSNSTSWQWFFEGGNPSSFNGQTPPSVCYDSAGAYDVSLITANAYGTDTFYHPHYIVVQDGPNVHIYQSHDTLTCSDDFSFQWYYESREISGATNQFYVASQYGLYQVMAMNMHGCTATDSFQYISTGTSGLTSDNITISPNPGEGVFNVFVPSSLNNGTLEVYNTLGEKLIDTRLKTQDARPLIIDLSIEPDGVYFVKVQTGNASYIKKLVVSR